MSGSSWAGIVGTVGQGLELVAVVWAAFELRRLRRRIRAIRKLAQDVGQVEPTEQVAFFAREQTVRGLESEDAQFIDALYPKTFLAEQVLAAQAATLKGPGMVILLGLAISLVSSAMTI